MEKYKYLGALDIGLSERFYRGEKGYQILLTGLQPEDFNQVRQEVNKHFPGRIRVRKTLLTFLGFGSECILTKVA